MELIFNGSSELGAHINQVFRLLMAFGYIDREVKSDLFKKRTFFLLSCELCSELPSNISAKVPTEQRRNTRLDCLNRDMAHEIWDL